MKKQFPIYHLDNWLSMTSNRDLVRELRFRNKNRKRIFAEMVLQQDEAEIIYSMLYVWSSAPEVLNKRDSFPEKRWKGIKNLMISIKNLLSITYGMTSQEFRQLESELREGMKYAPRSQMKKGLNKDLKILERKQLKKRSNGNRRKKV